MEKTAIEGDWLMIITSLTVSIPIRPKTIKLWAVNHEQISCQGDQVVKRTAGARRVSLDK